jgi:hypothetical protein
MGDKAVILIVEFSKENSIKFEYASPIAFIGV